MVIDLGALWDYSKPEVSEQRFRAAAASATSDEVLVLQTQIARTYGLRKDFTRAREILAGIEPQLPRASAEVQVRYHLELGRTYASPVHPPESQTAEARERARVANMRAFEMAQAARLDALAIDALHMMVMVDSAPADQLAWNMKALAYMEKSDQAAAKGWEGSLRNNVGYALHQAGRYPEALEQFEKALALRLRGTNVRATRIAYWMIAWTYRAMGRLPEALEIQLRLEREWDAAGEPDPYVFEELAHLYRALKDESKAAFYEERHRKSK
ncbi:MAG: tetratricopeptide repeat protein [Ramlibacter sp.]